MLRWLHTCLAVVAVALAGGCDTTPDPLARPEQPVSTPEGLIDASDPQPISDMAWRYGEASWSRDAFGDPRIDATMDGVPYQIEFFGCEEGRACKDIRFVTQFPSESEPDSDGLSMKVARWNLETRFGKASLGDGDELVLELNATLQGGVTRQNLDALFDWWRVALGDFRALAAGQ